MNASAAVLTPADRIRRLIAPAVVALFFVPSLTLAAPTCQNREGETLRCGTTGAMPVGWTAPRQTEDRSPPATLRQVFGLVSSLGIFFAVLALMPDFDGSAPGDWDQVEADRPGR